MKKLFLFLFAMISVSNLAFAQNEVRGVETKLVKYEGSEYLVGGGKYSNLWFGYQFLNLNSIPVSVDAELYVTNELTNEQNLRDTKTFVIEPKETYIWKFEYSTDFKVNYWIYNVDVTAFDRMRGIGDGRMYTKAYPGYSQSTHGRTYMIKYKAYKLE